MINDVTASDAYHHVSFQNATGRNTSVFQPSLNNILGYMNEIFIRMVFNNEMTEAEKEAKIKTSVALAEKLEKETKRLDPQRMSVMALHENEVYNTSGIADIPDVIGWNLYFGWYSPGLQSFGKFLDEQHERYPERPLIISEYGPGADVRNQTTESKPWDYSEAYQLELHRSYLNQVLERDYVLGMAAWNFADFGSSFRQDALPYINQKGLVNFDRSKKDIYYYYQARLLEEQVVYIAGENYSDRYLRDNENVKITIFSNSDKVDLRVNDSISYTSNVVDGIAEFELELAEGTHTLVAKAGEKSHSREFKIYQRSKLIEGIEEKPLRVNVGTHVNYKDPITQEIWINDQEYSEGNFGFIGGEVYQKSKDKFQGTASDIQGTENDPLFQTMREGIESYIFDVEKGNYKVTLLFAEPEFNASKENIYNLSSSGNPSNSEVRSFDVLINEKEVLKDLNPARDFGRIRAGKIHFIVKTEDGIKLDFRENSGNSILSGIKLEKL